VRLGLQLPLELEAAPALDRLREYQQPFVGNLRLTCGAQAVRTFFHPRDGVPDQGEPDFFPFVQVARQALILEFVHPGQATDPALVQLDGLERRFRGLDAPPQSRELRLQLLAEFGQVVLREGTQSASAQPLTYSLPTTWASTCDIWSWGLNSTILTASSTTTVCPEGQ
jgi:hypothetical protein